MPGKGRLSSITDGHIRCFVGKLYSCGKLTEEATGWRQSQKLSAVKLLSTCMLAEPHREIDGGIF